MAVAFQMNGQVRTEETDHSAVKEDIDVYDYPYPGDQVHRQRRNSYVKRDNEDRDAVRRLVVDVYGAGVKDVVSKLEVEEE